MADDYGVKVTLDGNDAASANDRQIVLDSSLVYPKIDIYADPSHFVKDTYTFSSNPGTGTTNLVTVAHGYTYTPANLTLINLTPTAEHYVLPVSLISGTTSFNAYCDSTSYYIDIYRTSSAVDISGTVMTYKTTIYAEDGD